MSEQQIKVLTVEDLVPGNYIAHVDDDFLTDSIVPAEAYDAGEQDWQKVIHVQGYVDLPSVTLAMYNGKAYTQKMQATAQVWVLVDANEIPVKDEVE